MIALLLALQAAAAAPSQPGAQLVAPGVINTDADEYGPTLSPDGRTMFFTLRADRRGAENIVMSVMDGDGNWSAPRVAPFSGGGFDKEPYLSPDGRVLYFASTRPWPGKDTTGTGEKYDIFVVEKTGDSWGAARAVPALSSPAYDNYPAVASNGNLYLASHRLSGRRNDLFVSPNLHGRHAIPRAIAELNSDATDADPYVAPDESFIIFSSDRPGGAGSGDLYVSFRRDGAWTAPVSLGPLVNTGDYEYTPWVTRDGRWLYFSRGWGEIWRIETAMLEALRR